MVQIKRIDFEKIRKLRQEKNIELLLNNVKDIKKFKKYVNKEKFAENLEYLGITEEEFFNECYENKNFLLQSCFLLAKQASRQGFLDEIEQLKTCNEISQQYGIKVEKLKSNEIRPTKDGKIVYEHEYKNNKRKNYLKSFDGKISGKIDGYISAKVCYNKGGHQDNVFEEMNNLADMWKNFKNKDKLILVILIDTNLKHKFKQLQDNYKKIENIFVFDHTEFQSYFIQNFTL